MDKDLEDTTDTEVKPREEGVEKRLSSVLPMGKIEDKEAKEEAIN